MTKTLDHLRNEARRLAAAPLPPLFDEPGRDAALTFEAAGIGLDARRQRLDLPAWRALQDWAASAGVSDQLAALHAGATVNPTEGRPCAAPRLPQSRAPV
jgi:glucose-6-phosphate isomerase